MKNKRVNLHIFDEGGTGSQGQGEMAGLAAARTQAQRILCSWTKSRMPG